MPAPHFSLAEPHATMSEVPRCLGAWMSLWLLVGCGRLGFGSHDDGGTVVGDGGPGLDSVDAPDAAMLPMDVAPADAALPSGLVVWLPLDATPQSTPDVVSGFGGTCSGATCPSLITGHRNGAFLFDGNDDCIQVANMGQFGQAQITLSLWIRQDIVDSCSPLAKPADSLGNTADTWQIETTTTNQLNFASSHGSTANARISTPTNTLVIGQWQHIAATFDGTTKRMYVNGTQVASGAMANALTYDVQPMWLGCDNNSGSFAMRFNGAIDEVQIYNRALSAAEIQMLAAM